MLSAKGPVQTKGHPFFEPFGENGRACITCHQPANAMSLSAQNVRRRWAETEGRDPVFAAIDGSNCPDLPPGDRASHSLLLDRGLFRIVLAWPPASKPDFRIDVVRDPTGCNTSSTYGLHGATPSISVFRRPRVAANFAYVLAGPEGLHFMADGREATLEAQAASAIRGHEQATPPAASELRRIAEFESQVYAAQATDVRAGLLYGKDAPAALSPQNLAAGAFAGFGGFDVWRAADDRDSDFQRNFRASVARGSDLFGAHCSSCHNAATTRWMNIGTAERDDPALPLFRLTCDSGRAVETHDPGRALISGKCADAGAIVLQQFRGLAARAPYFSDGSAQTLADVVAYYEQRLSLHYTAQEKQDLVNFLSVL